MSGDGSDRVGIVAVVAASEAARRQQRLGIVARGSGGNKGSGGNRGSSWDDGDRGGSGRGGGCTAAAAV